MTQTITTDMIKELRERTGGGMLECEKALDAAGGNIENAIDAMRKAGQAKAAKKTGRVASEGVILINAGEDGKSAFMVEVNSETDFVARDASFKDFAEKVAIRGLEEKANNLETFLSLPITKNDAKTISEARDELVAKIGENIQVRRVVFKTTNNYLDYYLHGVRIGVLVELSTKDQELAKDIAMHIAACSPQFISEKDVPASEIEREKSIHLAQAMESGKPKEIAEKMVVGKMQKFMAEITLLGQPFVKNPDITVAALLKSKNAEVLSFIRFAVGEGIEKKSVDFAAEVDAITKNL